MTTSPMSMISFFFSIHKTDNVWASLLSKPILFKISPPLSLRFTNWKKPPVPLASERAEEEEKEEGGNKRDNLYLILSQKTIHTAH